MAAPIQPPPVPPQLNPILTALQSGMGNAKTSLAGTALGASYYAGTVGLQMPQTKQDWINFGLALLFQILGLLAKDSTTGSQPAAKS